MLCIGVLVMAISGGFGVSLDLATGRLRRWYMRGDGIKRWISNNMPCDAAKETDLWRCTVCGRVGTVGRCCGEETREPYRPNKGHDAAMANERGGDE